MTLTDKADAQNSSEASLTALQLKAKKEKDLGNEAYKKKYFGKALTHYDKAIKLDPTNITYLTNKAAVFLEQEKIEECINLCKEAIKIGRENKSDSALIAKAYARIGNAYNKAKNPEKALEFYKQSLAEHQTQEIAEKKRELERALNIPSENEPFPIQKTEENKQKSTASGPDRSAINQMLELLSKMKNDSQLIDDRIKPYEVDTFPNGCDVQACKERLLEMFENTRGVKFHYAQLQSKYSEENPMDVFRRLGNTLPETLRWYQQAKRKPGSVFADFKPVPYDACKLHSYTSQVVKAEILTPATTHVAVGFNDLSIFYTARFLEQLSKEKPLKWVGFEIAPYSIAKTAIIVAMMEMDADIDHILQVWYSASWSRATLCSFRKAVEFLLNNKKKFAALSDPEVQILLMHWMRADVPLTTARQRWLENCTQFCFIIGNFRKKKDRTELCKYSITGDVLEGEVGSTIMWSLPEDYPGKIAMNETIFQTIHFESLMKERKATGSIMTAAVKYLRDGIRKIKSYITEKQVLVDIHYNIVSIENTDVIKQIAALDPYTISWSNCCDYCTPKDFHKMAKSCSGKSTIHFAHSINWPQRVFGTSFIDYKANTKEGGDFLDALVKASSSAADMLYLMLGCKDILHSPPVADLRNLAECGLYVTYKQKWIDFFFSKSVSGIDDMERQLQTEKTYFNFFDRSHSTIYYTFNYDPTSAFMGF